MTTSIATTLQHNRRPLATTLAVSAALAFSTLSGDLLRPVLSDPAVLAVPYLRSALTTLCDLLVMLALVWMASGQTPPQQLRGCGLGMPAAPALRWAAMVFAPATLGALLLASPAEELGPADFIWPTLAAPLLEEIFYRGLAVGALMRLAQWKLWPACLWPALFFGLAHLWQGGSWADASGVVAITGAGGLLFGWLYVRWNNNLWPPVLLHIGMNTLWTTFAFGDDAVGGWLGNALRLLTVATALVATRWLAPPAHTGRAA